MFLFFFIYSKFINQLKRAKDNILGAVFTVSCPKIGRALIELQLRGVQVDLLIHMSKRDRDWPFLNPVLRDMDKAGKLHFLLKKGFALFFFLHTVAHQFLILH